MLLITPGEIAISLSHVPLAERESFFIHGKRSWKGPVRSDFRDAIAYLRLSLIDIVYSLSQHSDTDQVHPEMRLKCKCILFCV